MNIFNTWFPRTLLIILVIVYRALFAKILFWGFVGFVVFILLAMLITVILYSRRDSQLSRLSY